MTRTRLVLLFGGRSTEHAISCLSAGSVLATLDPARYDVVAVGITPEGRWVLGPTDLRSLRLQGRTLPTITDGTPAVLAGDPSSGGLRVREGAGEVLHSADVVWPLLHGPYGEDGTVQGLLELADVPYVGSGVLASAAAMDKAIAKVLLRDAGLPVADAVVLRRGDDLAAVDRLRLPVFVKPARGGSSIGITRVDEVGALAAALETAWSADPKALVESSVVGREIECGVLDGPAGPEASLPAEIHAPPGGFYDFDTKYLDGARLDVPADLPEATVRQVQQMAVAAFRALGCEGLARVDFFVPEQGLPTVNEVNTMPGFTPTSMFPRMWAASGLAYEDLVDRLVQTALTRPVGLR